MPFTIHVVVDFCCIAVDYFTDSCLWCHWTYCCQAANVHTNRLN